VSGLLGINLDSIEDLPESLTRWYNEARGKDEQNKKPICLMDLIDSFRGMKRPYNKPARVCVYDYYNKDQDGFAYVFGDCLSVKVESGVIKEKDKLLL